MRLVIRNAASADAAAAAELYLRARRAASAAGTIPPPVHDDDHVTGWVTTFVIPRLACWLAEDESAALVGMLVLDGESIDQLYVEPRLTGVGIGSELIAVAKRERPGGLRLWTFASNVGAQRFYKRHECREVDRTDGSGNEERAPDILYVWTRA